MEELYMTNRSHVDVAYDIVKESKNPIPFVELWKKIADIQELSAGDEEKIIGNIYTQLLLDGRFINLGDNTWDLRDRYTFEKATLDTNECYSDDDDDEEEIDPEESEDEDHEEDDEEKDEDSEESSEKSSSEFEEE